MTKLTSKAILIRPKYKEVMLIDFDNSLKGPNGFYKLLECDHIELFATNFPKRENCFYCDGEALLKDMPTEEKYQTWFTKANMGVQGNVLIVGPSDDEGEHTDVTCTVEDVEKYIDCYSQGEQYIPPTTIYSWER